MHSGGLLIFIYHFYLQEVLMKLLSLEQELSSNAYPGRGIVLGLTRMEHMQSLLISLWAAVSTAVTVSL